jgi:hypothetical protein
MLNLTGTIQVVFQALILAFVGFFLGNALLDEWKRMKKKAQEPKTDVKQ